MAIDFPANPTVGQQYLYQGATYQYTPQGTWALVGGGGTVNSLAVRVQKFTVTGIYTPSANLQFAVVECIGGGGGGGGMPGAIGQYRVAGGGGSGGYSRAYLTAAQIATGQMATVGAGGTAGVGSGASGGAGSDTSFGSLCVAKGGIGAVTATHAGGLGGSTVGAVGDITAAGAAGEAGALIITTSGTAGGGGGGSSAFGGGPSGILATDGTAPTAPSGSGYGSGGAGSSVQNVATNGTAGAGSAGIVIITEYIAATGLAGSSGTGNVSTDGTAVAGQLAQFTTPFAVRGANIVFAPQGRLTLQTATPVMTTTQSAKTTLFYTPYVGDQIGLYDGTNFVMTTFTELSNITTNSAVGNAGPAAVGAGLVYDLFVWSNAGVPTLTRSPAWTGDASRTPATDIVKVKGIWLNANAITNGPVAQRGTYVGTVRSNASSQFVWQFPTSGTPGVAGNFWVWNAYNRINVCGTAQDLTGSWTYNSITPRLANNSAAMSVFWVAGLEEDEFYAQHLQSTQAGASGLALNGVSFDVTNAFATGSGAPFFTNGSGIFSNGTGFLGRTALGAHYFGAMEACNSGGVTVTFWGSQGAFYFRGRM